jgi:hypothetical protein
MPESTQTGLPVAQEIVAVRHGPDAVHVPPATQVTHWPDLQTWLLPHEVPSVSCRLPLHSSTPVLQLVVPRVHGVGLHSLPGVQD